MTQIILTSFQKAKQLPQGTKVWSVAVYQPKGLNYPKLDFFDIRKDGRWIRPRNFLAFKEPLKAYRSVLYDHFAKRSEEIQEWFANNPGPHALCCWCPYEKAAQRQLKEFGSFVCHTGVIFQVLQDLGLPVTLDQDRQDKMNKLW